MEIQLNYLARVKIGKDRTEASDQLRVGSGNLSQGITWVWYNCYVTNYSASLKICKGIT